MENQIDAAHAFDWKRLQSRYVVSDRWLSVRADTCQMPNGRIVEPFYVLEYPIWVNVVAFTKNQEVVLVRQYRHGIQRTVLELPAGAMDGADQSPLEAAKRELLEESGYTSEEFIATGIVAPNSGTHNNLTHCFLATNVEQVAEATLDPTEQIEVVLLPMAQVIELIEDSKFLQAQHVSSVFFALKHLGKLKF